MSELRDEENICLKCKKAIVYEGSKGFDANGNARTLCFCLYRLRGKNAGRRRTCKDFEEKEKTR